MTICKPDTMKGLFWSVYPLPDLQGLPDSYGLGVCGVTGYVYLYSFSMMIIIIHDSLYLNFIVDLLLTLDFLKSANQKLEKLSLSHLQQEPREVWLVKLPSLKVSLQILLPLSRQSQRDAVNSFLYRLQGPRLCWFRRENKLGKR